MLHTLQTFSTVSEYRNAALYLRYKFTLYTTSNLIDTKMARIPSFFVQPASRLTSALANLRTDNNYHSAPINFQFC